MKTSQRDRIRNLFLSLSNQEIPLTDILDLRISQYGRVIHELRGTGMTILNRTKFIDGVNHSWFKYVPRDKSGQLRLI